MTLWPSCDLTTYLFNFYLQNSPVRHSSLGPLEPTAFICGKQVTISSVKQSKTNVTHLSRRNKATSASDRRPSRSLSSLQRWKADLIFTRVLLLVTLSTPDASGVAWQNTIELIIISDAIYTGCGAGRHDESLTVNFCHVLFMTHWHKFQMISTVALSRPV